MCSIGDKSHTVWWTELSNLEDDYAEAQELLKRLNQQVPDYVIDYTVEWDYHNGVTPSHRGKMSFYATRR